MLEYPRSETGRSASYYLALCQGVRVDARWRPRPRVVSHRGHAPAQVISYDLGLDSCVSGAGYGRKYSPHTAFFAPLTFPTTIQHAPIKKYRIMRPKCAPMLIQVPRRPHEAPSAKAQQRLQPQTGTPGRPKRTKRRMACESW